VSSSARTRLDVSQCADLVAVLVGKNRFGEPPFYCATVREAWEHCRQLAEIYQANLNSLDACEYRDRQAVDLERAKRAVADEIALWIRYGPTPPHGRLRYRRPRRRK